MPFLSPVPQNRSSMNSGTEEPYLLFKPHHFDTLSNCKLLRSWNGAYKGIPGVFVWRKNFSRLGSLDQLVFLPHRADMDTVILKSIPTPFKSVAFSKKVDKCREKTELPIDRILQHQSVVLSNGWMQASPISPPAIESPVEAQLPQNIRRRTSRSIVPRKIHSLIEGHEPLGHRGYLSQNDDEDIFSLY